jgi:hypothetical protein
MKRKVSVIIDDENPLIPKWGERSRVVHPLMVLLSGLKVGESFTWPPMAKENLELLRARAHGYGKSSKKKFATRMVTRGRNKPSMMFWRTK